MYFYFSMSPNGLDQSKLLAEFVFAYMVKQKIKQSPNILAKRLVGFVPFCGRNSHYISNAEWIRNEHPDRKLPKRCEKTNNATKKENARRKAQRT